MIEGLRDREHREKSEDTQRFEPAVLRDSFMRKDPAGDVATKSLSEESLVRFELPTVQEGFHGFSDLVHYAEGVGRSWRRRIQEGDPGFIEADQ
jgi:hypothetical protein